VFHVRALHYIKTLIANKCRKKVFIINCNTLLHVSTLLGHLQGQLFVIVTLRLHFIVEWECAVVCVLCTGGVNTLQAGTAESSRLLKQFSTQSTAHSHSTIKCNLSVTITKICPWRWPSRVETCRSVLQLMIKLSLGICWWLVFSYNTKWIYLATSEPTLQLICSQNKRAECNRTHVPVCGIRENLQWNCICGRKVHGLLWNKEKKKREVYGKNK
jgi:hypothetical protein